MSTQRSTAAWSSSSYLKNCAFPQAAYQRLAAKKTCWKRGEVFICSSYAGGRWKTSMEPLRLDQLGILIDDSRIADGYDSMMIPTGKLHKATNLIVGLVSSGWFLKVSGFYSLSYLQQNKVVISIDPIDYQTCISISDTQWYDISWYLYLHMYIYIYLHLVDIFGVKIPGSGFQGSVNVSYIECLEWLRGFSGLGIYLFSCASRWSIGTGCSGSFASCHWDEGWFALMTGTRYAPNPSINWVVTPINGRK